MSISSSGLNGLNLNASVIMRPMGNLTLLGSIGTDLIIPENLSDTATILKTDCDVKINEIISSNNAVTARGSASYTILLLGDDGSLGSVKTSEEFELKDFIEDANESTVLVYGGSNAECSSRLINPRKVNISSDISVSVSALREENVNPEIKGTETIEDEISLKRRMGNITCIDTYSLNEKDIPVSSDVSIDGNLPPMSQILYSNVSIRPTELTTAGNNVTVKSKAVFSAIYKSEEGNIFAIEKPILLEKTIEADNAESFEWFADVTADDVTAEIAIDGYGEAKLIELDFAYDIILNGVRNVTVDTVTDAYSTEYDCKTDVLHSECVTYNRAYNSSLSVNASADRGEISAESVRAVMLGGVNLRDVQSQYSDEKRRLVVEATATVSAVCENNIVSDEDERFSSVSFEYPFKCELDVGEKHENTSYNVTLTVTDTRFRCDQNKIYCDFENEIRAVSVETVPHCCLTSIVIDKCTPISASYAPITLCYPSGGETLWDIAKYYKVSLEGIAASNNLDGDDISGKKVLLIPSYRRTKPIYSASN
ncbi:MAG: LysM peptidoglycan-binding domain-containing protein [Clostridia bacterium]|nr:LysM peptidoglycan-binding domain-containing protein [Clostridia bacterium]